MKYLASLLLLALSPGASAETKLRFRDAATHEQLVNRRDKTGQADPMKKFPVSAGEDPSVKSSPDDLISQSDIICFNGMATLVPKRAIIRTPEGHCDRMMMTAGSRLVGWSEFLAANRAWVTTEEVSISQASGREALADADIERIGKSEYLIVATYLGGPISVMEKAGSPSEPHITETEKP